MGVFLSRPSRGLLAHQSPHHVFGIEFYRLGHPMCIIKFIVWYPIDTTVIYSLIYVC